MMAKPINVEVTPYMQGTQTKWSLTIVSNGKHGGYGNYPDVKVTKGDADVPMVYTITNGNGWKFAKDGAALWASDSGQDPTGPSVSTQINPSTIQTTKGDTELHFVNSNGAPGAVHYTLNFVNGSQTSTTLDPIIDNGGPGRNYELAWWAIGGFALGAVAVILLRPKFGKPVPVERPGED